VSAYQPGGQFLVRDVPVNRLAIHPGCSGELKRRKHVFGFSHDGPRSRLLVALLLADFLRHPGIVVGAHLVENGAPLVVLLSQKGSGLHRVAVVG
jgi:hypothetical protein